MTPPVSADLSRLLFDGRYEQTHQDLHELLLDPVFDPREGLTMAEAGRLAYERSRAVHAGLERPREILADPWRLFALAEWPSLVDVSTFSLLMVHYNLAFGTVVEHGARDDLKDLFDELDRLDSFSPYMATELGYGNNVAALRTEAVYDAGTGTFVLNTPDALAQKYMSYSGFQDIPKLAVVMARLKADGRDHGVFPFLVRISDRDGLRPGVHAAPCPEKPVQGLDNGLTWFDHVRVPRRNLLHGDMGGFDENGVFRPAAGNQRKRFLRAMSRILPGRLCVSSAATGAGRAAVYIALRYAARRLTNAPGRNDLPVIEYRSHQLALFTALAKTYAMTLLLNHAKREFTGAPRDAVPAGLGDLVSITKALATWEMTEVVATCRERCGAQGIFSVNRIADYGSLLQGLVTAEGDNQVLLATTAGQIIARGGDGAEDGAEPDTAPDPRGRSLRDPAFLVAALRHRERELLRAARAAMADDSGDRTYFEAWNGTINSGLEMARARGVRIALECFTAAVDAARDETARAALGLLAALYGLTEVRRAADWLLARGVLTAEQVERLPVEADALCAEIRPYADTLTDGFNLSPELLRAPIAADDYVAAFQRRTGAFGPAAARPAEGG
ncbi:acyl-CoA dehydrogenase [Streptomyces sparsogenes]|uniref:Putative acyl CoA oxidase n=1 Tax=Streptomyces sparsogenes DSM 40356 TaxID=1331668 RepID=A0A1R1SEW0_9ACTN|nr:acyl-CoA dehydrogenase [Streptomyces sparsogenes]OMI36549.1 putative acyl CoA oxidase [Streptomyces sparsogenes DSM 40356]